MITRSNRTTHMVSLFQGSIAAVGRTRAVAARFIGLVLTTFVVAATATLGAAAPASAAYGCSDSTYPNVSYIRTYDDHNGIEAALSYGRYTSSGILDGRCDNLVAQNQYYGMYKWMSLETCGEQSRNCKTDSGYFYYYAGPITHSKASDGWCPHRRDYMRNSSGVTIMNWGYTGWPCN